MDLQNHVRGGRLQTRRSHSASPTIRTSSTERSVPATTVHTRSPGPVRTGPNERRVCDPCLTRGSRRRPRPASSPLSVGRGEIRILSWGCVFLLPPRTGQASRIHFLSSNFLSLRAERSCRAPLFHRVVHVKMYESSRFKRESQLWSVVRSFPRFAFPSSQEAKRTLEHSR